MALKLDALSRRFRFAKPASTGRLLLLTERDHFWFEKLHRHGPLPTSYLLAYSKQLRRADNRARDRLTALYNEKNTPHRGTYLARPWQQRLSLSPLNSDTIHDVTPHAIDVLKEAHRYRAFAPPHAGHLQFKHDLMLSCFTASIELAVLQEPDRFEYIFHDEICERMQAPMRFQMPNRKWLKPDRAFGIRYKTDGSVRIFLVEADRGTEQNAVSPGRKTAIENLQQYRDFLTKKLYQEPMRYKGGLMLVMLFTSPGKMHNVEGHLRDLTGGGANYVLFKELAGFTNDLKPPPPLAALFTEPYARVGREGFYLNKE